MPPEAFKEEWEEMDEDTKKRLQKEAEEPTNDKVRMKERINAVKYRTVIRDGTKYSERIEV